MKELPLSDRMQFGSFRPDDAEFLAITLNNIEISRHITPMPRPYMLSMAQSYIAQTLTSSDETFALEIEGHLSGAIGIGDRLGFWLAPARWGLGLVTNALRAVIDWHFTHEANYVRSGFHEGNSACARVHEKLGFKPDGATRVIAKALGREVVRNDLLLTAQDWATTPPTVVFS